MLVVVQTSETNLLRAIDHCDNVVLADLRQAGHVVLVSHLVQLIGMDDEVLVADLVPDEVVQEDLHDLRADVINPDLVGLVVAALEHVQEDAGSGTEQELAGRERLPVANDLQVGHRSRFHELGEVAEEVVVGTSRDLHAEFHVQDNHDLVRAADIELPQIELQRDLRVRVQQGQLVQVCAARALLSGPVPRP